MTQSAIIVMSVSISAIVLLFLFCIGKVMFSPASEQDDAEAS